MPTDYRKVAIDVCRADIDRLRDVVRSALILGDQPATAEVAEGVVLLLLHAYDATVDDLHDQVDPPEYDAAERWFSKGRMDVQVVRQLHRGAIGVIHEGGDHRNDHYQYTEPVFERGWTDIPDLVGRAALEGTREY